MHISDKIRSVGLKVTPQRKIVYEIVKELSHASIEEIASRVQHEDSEITLSTIYRILNSFCDNNLLERVYHPNGKVYYDINTHDHHHLFTSKQTIIDINDLELTELIRQRVMRQIGEDEEIDKISIQITTLLKNNT